MPAPGPRNAPPLRSARPCEGCSPPVHCWPHALALAALLLVLQSANVGIHDVLRFTRRGLEHGEWWRLLTAHFVHLGWAHAALDALGVVLCCALAPHLFNAHIWLKTAGLAFGIGTLLWCCSPEVPNYVGLSGVLYGLFVLGLLPPAWRGDGIAAGALAVSAGWMIWQWAAGPSALEEGLIGGRVIAIAHVYGFGLGVAGVALTWRLQPLKHLDKT